MYYIIMGHDKAGAPDLRLDNRAAHLSYWQGFEKQGRLAFGGPILDAQGQMCGSMLALKADSEAEARAAAENDPYNKAGLFARVEIHGWKWALNPPAAS